MEFFRLCWLNLTVTIRNSIEFCRVIKRYYSNKTFKSVDSALLQEYFFSNPFRISKAFLKEQGAEDIYAYGETPLTTMDLIAKECQISSADVVYELGCGRGRACFWLQSFIGCRVVGVEFVPAFVEKAEKLRLSKQIQNIEFRLEDILKADFSDATVVYFYGTCSEEGFIERLIEKLKQLPPGTRIITVSYALEDFDTKEFVLERSFPAMFTWGWGEVYLQVRRKPEST